MQTKTKQRVIGGIVLLAVVAIFLPLLFHNSRPSADLKLSTNVPLAPAKPEVQLQLPAISSPKPISTSVNIAQAGDAQPQSSEAVAQETPAVSQRILNTTPAPAVTPKVADHVVKLHDNATTKPAIKPAEEPAPKHNPKTSAKQTVKKPVVSAKKTAAKPVEPVLKSSVPEAWVIQVASFSNSANAKRLVKQLRVKGFDVYMRENQLNQRTITRVFVGPIIDQHKVKQLQQQLKQQFQLKGVIKRYSV
ncbi:SPOR domain-containing protein [Candidiatus Paracoxiella cheracis]|uniref:SPOR domain-containing protein n=1 Tax=Candidiatus Paracoxiella cheracis TaxID=3405120 RepID=UPI003BF4B64F